MRAYERWLTVLTLVLGISLFGSLGAFAHSVQGSQSNFHKVSCSPSPSYYVYADFTTTGASLDPAGNCGSSVVCHEITITASWYFENTKEAGQTFPSEWCLASYTRRESTPCDNYGSGTWYGIGTHGCEQNWHWASCQHQESYAVTASLVGFPIDAISQDFVGMSSPTSVDAIKVSTRPHMHIEAYAVDEPGASARKELDSVLNRIQRALHLNGAGSGWLRSGMLQFAIEQVFPSPAEQAAAYEVMEATEKVVPVGGFQPLYWLNIDDGRWHVVTLDREDGGHLWTWTLTKDIWVLSDVEEFSLPE